MKISSKKSGRVFVIQFSGDLMGDIEDVNAFKNLIFEAIEDDLVNFVVDLKQVNWMNSSGLGMVISGLTTARSSGGDLKLANVSDRNRRPLELTRLDSVFSIYDSIEEAVTSF